jgi:hypothetical protein
LQNYFQIIQDVLGKDIFLAAWDSEQEMAFPPIRTPTNMPASRESLGIYFATYVNPRAEGSQIYLNLRLVTTKPHHVPLNKFGMELSEHFARSKHRLTINRQPKPCQAAKSECIGWMMYSSKTINSESFIPAIKKALNIPAEVEIGTQYRAIMTEYGKKPTFNKENPPTAAIHLDMDKRYALVYQAKAASLWRKNSKKRLPNGIQLRLVPCFGSITGKSMTDKQSSDAKTLTERQYYFVKEHLKMLPPYYFISQLDTPLSDDNPITLRRAMMAQAPAKLPSNRLIHNVDIGWGQTSRYSITTVVGREQEASRFLSNLIPEYLHRFGEEASKWFSSAGLIVYKDIKWNPTKGTTTSTNEHVSEAMVQEDLWGLNAKWEEIKANKTVSNTSRPDPNKLDATGNSTTDDTKEPNATDTQAPTYQTRLGSDKSIASFGNVYQRPKDADDTREEAILAKAAAETPIDLTGTQFEFSPEQLEKDRQKSQAGPPSTGFSMSTMGKTTESTRLKLKEAQEELGALRLQLAKQTLSSNNTIGSPEDTPEGTEQESQHTETDPKTKHSDYNDPIKLGKEIIQHLTDAQVIAAALAKKHRHSEYRKALKKDDMEEDAHPPTPTDSPMSS